MINKEMKIGKLANQHPELVSVLFEFGMGCIGCPSAQAESIEEACFVHGIKVDDLLSKLNEKCEG